MVQKNLGPMTNHSYTLLFEGELLGVPAGGTEKAGCTPTCESGESGLSLWKGLARKSGSRVPCGPSTSLHESLQQSSGDMIKNLSGSPVQEGTKRPWAADITGRNYV